MLHRRGRGSRVSRDWHKLLGGLPIAAACEPVLAALDAGNAVLQAEPGAGKSTGLPLALLRAELPGKILLLEPRRLAAVKVANRLAAQLGEPLGQTVGLRMRGRTEVGPSTRLEVVTEGVLTRVLQADPMLEGVGLVIFDEFHERSLQADLGLALCLDVQRGLREDLRLLLMSATLDGAALCGPLGADAPIVCRVRQHPVERVWLGESRGPLQQAMAGAIARALREHDGDLLAFLPGVAEIERTARALQGRLPEGVALHRLHGGANEQAQRAATAPAGVQRRVILSTSIAETSITIDGVRIVVDSGLERRTRVDANGVERLQTVTASQASATQRAGRAGRTQPGVCYRLWAESGHSRRAELWQPELLRAELAPLVLELARWGVADPADLPWLEPPPAAALQRGRQLLRRLGLWSAEGQGAGPSAAGRAAAQLPLSPRLAAMLLWAREHGGLEQALPLAALLEELPRSGEADIAALLQRPPPQCRRRVAQLRRALGGEKGRGVHPGAVPTAALLLRAFPDRLAQRRPGQLGRFLLSGGGGAQLREEDPLAACELLAVAELGGGAGEARIFAALELRPEELEVYAADLIEERPRVDWDEREQRIVAEQQRRLGAVLLSAKALQQIDPDLCREALIAGVRKLGLECLPWTEEVQEWRARVGRLRALEGAASDYPAVDDASLLASLEQWLAPWIDKQRSIKALAQLDLATVLRARLDYAQQQRLDAELPTRYRVPSGSQIKLRYAVEGSPVLAVKLQEMFGCRENPSVAGGRVGLKVELLSPARRPVQITEDLANFWHNSYPAVKKDLAGRYPKHPWPDDPLQAEATARAKPRKR